MEKKAIDLLALLNKLTTEKEFIEFLDLLSKITEEEITSSREENE